VRKKKKKNMKKAEKYGLSSADVQPSIAKKMSNTKLKNFVMGKRTKSAFEKQKEEQEARRKQEEEAAAQVFKEFTESLEADDGVKKAPLTSSFVRGGVVMPGSTELDRGRPDSPPRRRKPMWKPGDDDSDDDEDGLGQAFKMGGGGGGSSRKRKDPPPTATSLSPPTSHEGVGGVGSMGRSSSFSSEVAAKKSKQDGKGSLLAVGSRPGLAAMPTPVQSSSTAPQSLPLSTASFPPHSGGGGGEKKKKALVLPFDNDDDDDSEDEAKKVLLGRKTLKIGKEKREMDEFLAEMKAKSEHEEKVSARAGLVSSEESDPNSTNLYISGLPPSVTEEALVRAFCPFGDVGTIKIMHPRTDDERRRPTITAFVSFFTRKEAERAKIKAIESVFLGKTAKILWGKTMPLPPQPLASSSCTAVRTTGARMGENGTVLPPSYVLVQPPEDPFVKALIDRFAKYVAKEGIKFERVVLDREKKNKDYDFARDDRSIAHTYYKWRVFSYASGDNIDRWKMIPFAMTRGGPLWLPPSRAEVLDESGEGMTKLIDGLRTRSALRQKRALRPRNTLHDDDRDVFEDILRGVTLDRAKVKEGMVFAMDHAEHAGEIVHTLKEALTLPETAPLTKLGRFYILSDILFNCQANVPNAKSYKDLIQDVVGEVIDSMRQAAQTPDLGRMTSTKIRSQVIRAISVWKDWSVFTAPFLAKLENRFEKPDPNEKDDDEKEAEKEKEGGKEGENQSGSGKEEERGEDVSMNVDEECDGMEL